VTDIAATVRRVTTENVKAIAARMFDEQNYVLAVLRPASRPLPAHPEIPNPADVLGSPDIGP
jgi:hypothetical protein